MSKLYESTIGTCTNEIIMEVHLKETLAVQKEQGNMLAHEHLDTDQVFWNNMFWTARKIYLVIVLEDIL